MGDWKKLADRNAVRRLIFAFVHHRLGDDLTAPIITIWGDVVAAVNAAAAAIRQRFGPAGLVGAVTPAQVLVAVSGGRLLSPGWSWMR